MYNLKPSWEPVCIDATRLSKITMLWNKDSNYKKYKDVKLKSLLKKMMMNKQEVFIEMTYRINDVMKIFNVIDHS